MSDRLAVVLVAHGSRDPRAAASTSALTEAVARAYPGWQVHASYLDFAGPRPLDVLRRLAETGHRRAVLVPLLLTAAYHGKVDVPAVVREARAEGLAVDIRLTDVLGPPGAGSPVEPLLLDALLRRLPVDGLEAVVLAAAGTRVAAARLTVERVAVRLGERLGVPCTVAYAASAPPTAGAAVAAYPGLRVGVASYFLAPGLLYDNAMASARAGGAVAVADPLGDGPELVALIGARVTAAVSEPYLTAA